MNIAVVGLGKLGSCLAAILASKKNLVTGVDINANTVKLLNQQKAPVIEPGLDSLLKKCKKNLNATMDLKSAAQTAEIIFIVVPTPSKKNGTFSLEFISKVCRDIGKGLKTNQRSYPVVVITSTVLPGDCEQTLLPILEKHSGKKCGKGFGFCYNPEFIALGSVIRDMKYPDLVLIGEKDEKSGKILADLYRKIIESKAPIQRMNLVNAEIVKLSINTFVTTKISYANMITQICHNTNGADIDVVSETIGIDKRIGTKYLKGGSPYGGPCFPRDNRAFAKMAQMRNVNAYIAKATDKVNDAHLNFILKTIESYKLKSKKIGLIGLSYKSGTGVIEESAGIKLAEKLISKNYEVSFFDPLVMESGIKELKKESNLTNVLKNNHLTVILNNGPGFAEIKSSNIPKDAIIIDCWRILKGKNWANNKNIVSLGTPKNKS